MTPEQQRLLCPLTPQTPVQTAVNLVSALSLAWPFSIARAAVMGYCETFVAVLDPMPLHDPRPVERAALPRCP
jgi:hypothetical protein